MNYKHRIRSAAEAYKDECAKTAKSVARAIQTLNEEASLEKPTRTVGRKRQRKTD